MSATIIAPQAHIPIRDEVDVLVLGAGPAGVAAAVCAARQGASTLLIEQTGDVGGIATAGLMSHWTGNTEGGLYEEILDRSCEGGLRQVINPEKLKTALFEMLEEAGARTRLYTFASEPIMQGDRIQGAILQSKAGRQAVLAKVVIDATGDGDIAAGAGAPFYIGRESDGAMQPMTLMFKVAGVDTERAIFPGAFEETADVPGGEIQALARHHLPHPAGHVLLYRSTLPGVVTCNMTNYVGANGTDPDDLTRATVACRRQMEAIVAFLRQFAPGYERCYVISSASLIGVRETRHFQGEYVLTEQDILASRVFEDWAVAKASFNFDVHNLTGEGLDATGSQKDFPDIKGYTIPYRCFLPLAVEGLLLAGRCLSGTHMAHSNFRVMPICANMGQAAGIAAALCAAQGIAPRELDVSRLQTILRAQGVAP